MYHKEHTVYPIDNLMLNCIISSVTSFGGHNKHSLIKENNGKPTKLSLIHISEPTRPY